MLFYRTSNEIGYNPIYPLRLSRGYQVYLFLDSRRNRRIAWFNTFVFSSITASTLYALLLSLPAIKGFPGLMSLWVVAMTGMALKERCRQTSPLQLESAHFGAHTMEWMSFFAAAAALTAYFSTTFVTPWSQVTGLICTLFLALLFVPLAQITYQQMMR
ncbi:MAG: hypothetical protein EA349_16185 [Halomonadaceae bacterium]|nr:MAG: hypothetical protein EA349_16185 [Halomonadaceae bacterium]